MPLVFIVLVCFPCRKINTSHRKYQPLLSLSVAEFMSVGELAAAGIFSLRDVSPFRVKFIGLINIG
jgi:hypothetical protein